MDQIILKERISSKELFANGLTDLPCVKSIKAPKTKKESYLESSAKFMVKEYGYTTEKAEKEALKDWERIQNA